MLFANMQMKNDLFTDGALGVQVICLQTVCQRKDATIPRNESKAQWHDIECVIN